MSFYVYILESLKDGRRYIGHTSDIEKRLRDHNDGRTSSTRNRRPFKVLCYKVFGTKLEAARYEKYLKSLKGGNGLKRIIEELKNMPL